MSYPRSNDVALDRKISPPGRSTNVPAKEAAKFTDLAPNVPFDLAGPRSGLWSTLNWNVKRTFVRPGVAYVHINGRGYWKMDLHHCEILDSAKPLVQLMTKDEIPDRSILGRIFKLYRGHQAAQDEKQ